MGFVQCSFYPDRKCWIFFSPRLTVFAVTTRSMLSDTATNIYLPQTACMEHAGICLSLTTCQSLAAILHPPERPIPRTHPFRPPQNAEVLFRPSFATATKRDRQIFFKNPHYKILPPYTSGCCPWKANAGPGQCHQHQILPELQSARPSRSHCADFAYEVVHPQHLSTNLSRR